MKRFTFTQSSRIVKSTQFTQLMKNGRRLAGQYFVILCLPSSQGKPRLGVTVSKKVSRSAVKRNRIKRIIRDAFRCQQYQLAELDLVVIAKPNCALIEGAELRQDLGKLWVKLQA